MPTESFEIADSQDVAYNAGVTGERVRVVDFESETQNDVIDNVRDALVAAGWIQTGGSKPQFTAEFTYGLPSAIPPGVPFVGVMPVSAGTKVLTAQGIIFRFYDANVTLPGVGGVWIPMATTSAGSLALLIAEVESYTVW